MRPIILAAMMALPVAVLPVLAQPQTPAAPMPAQQAPAAQTPAVQTPAPQAPVAQTPPPQPMATSLRAASTFANIGDQTERSRALFGEAMKVIGHPRCMNCHPVTDRPTQGDNYQPHQPPVTRGPANFGAAGMQCNACHTQSNVPTIGETIRSVPGDPVWHLAPLSMGWQTRSPGFICEQLKDTSRNGGKSLAEIHKHMAEDHLVGWGWSPGEGRTPAPGTQAAFGEIIKAWIDTGAACPAP